MSRLDLSTVPFECRIYSLDDAGIIIGKSRSSVKTLADRGELRCSNLGTSDRPCYVVTGKAILDYVHHRQVKPKGKTAKGHEESPLRVQFEAKEKGA